MQLTELLATELSPTSHYFFLLALEVFQKRRIKKYYMMYFNVYYMGLKWFLFGAAQQLLAIYMTSTLVALIANYWLWQDLYCIGRHS